MNAKNTQGATHQPGLDDPQPAPAGHREGNLDDSSMYHFAWQFAGHVSSGALLVLLALASVADISGQACISLTCLADQCSMTRRNIIKHIKTLENIGAVAVVRTREVGSSPNQNVYFINTTNKLAWFNAKDSGGPR